MQVSPLGGDPGWLPTPDLALTWALAALRSGGGSIVQLDVEPWTTPGWTSNRPLVCRQWLALLDRVRAGLPSGVGLGIDVPWWLAHEPYGAGTLLDEVLARASRIAVVAFSNHAQGPDGIVSLAGTAAVAAASLGTPFTIGVETDTAEVAGGPQYTFAGVGAAALESETLAVRDAFDQLPGYQGVTVEHHRAWRRLLGLDPAG